MRTRPKISAVNLGGKNFEVKNQRVERANCLDQGGLYRNPSCEGAKNMIDVRIVVAGMTTVGQGSLGLRFTGLFDP